MTPNEQPDIPDRPKKLAPKGRKKRLKTRDTSRAVMLRPADIWQLYGIPSSTLCSLCTQPREGSEPPPSLQIRGRCGRRGIRLFNKIEFEAWLVRAGTEVL